jgi:hypothetical protein
LVSFDYGVREQLLAHLADVALRVGSRRMGELKVDHFTDPDLSDFAEAHSPKALGEGVALGIENGIFVENRHSSFHWAPPN